MRFLNSTEIESVSGANDAGWSELNWGVMDSDRTYMCRMLDEMQISGAAGAVFGAAVAGYGLLSGPGEAAFGPIGGAIALAGGATQGLGYLGGKLDGCN